MTITAKYPGTCPTCQKAIQPGQQVEWSKGSKARHTDCAAANSVPTKPTTTTAAPKRRYHQYCADCGTASQGYYRCRDCNIERREGGSRYMGGRSYLTHDGRFVLGDDD